MQKIKSLSEQVSEYIIRQIKLGKLPFGEKINESVLIDELGISRTPIRESLIQLSSDGILESIPRKGFFVKAISSTSVREAYDIIAQLDAYAAVLALPSITDNMVQKFRTKLEKIDLAIEDKDYDLYCTYQEEFHSIYLEVCGNETLIQLIHDMERKYVRTTYYSTDLDLLFPILRRAQKEHFQILDCIIQRDADGLARLLRAHWSNFIEEMY